MLTILRKHLLKIFLVFIFLITALTVLMMNSEYVAKKIQNIIVAQLEKKYECNLDMEGVSVVG